MTLESAHNVEKHLGAQQNDPRVDQLIARLPPRLNAAVRWLRRPASAWMRRATAMLLICGGLLGFLPILGLWMLPLGLLLLAEDCRRSSLQQLVFWIGSNADTQIGLLLNANRHRNDRRDSRTRHDGSIFR